LTATPEARMSDIFKEIVKGILAGLLAFITGFLAVLFFPFFRK
jgi:hypothetical protein